MHMGPMSHVSVNGHAPGRARRLLGNQRDLVQELVVRPLFAPAVELQSVACPLAIFVGEEARKFRPQHMSLDREVEATMAPQGSESIGWVVAPQQLSCRGEPAMV